MTGFALQRRLKNEGITVSGVHPGFVSILAIVYLGLFEYSVKFMNVHVYLIIVLLIT